MGRSQRLLRCDRGAVFVQIGISAFVLMAFNVFVLDYGMMWIARRQAQNAADAGALAGAVARGYDEVDSYGTVTQNAASLTASANLIWQQPGNTLVSSLCPAGMTGRCVRVDVDRNVETLFGPLLGVTTQAVRATATAIVGSGNATPCLKPLAVADNWVESGSTNPNEFNRYNELDGTLLVTPPPDSYTPPGTTISGNFGERIVLSLGAPFNSPITRGFVVPLDLPGGTFQENMLDCNGQFLQQLTLNKTLPVDMSLPTGDMTTSLQNDVFDLDASATWVLPRIGNSCAPGCATVSPRLLPIVLYNPAKFQLGRATGIWTQPDVGCPTNSPCVTISNIVGFFVHCVPSRPCDAPPEHGHFVPYPGVMVPGEPTVPDDASWLVTTHLVR
jgi:Flp pilus assembly protein TadG